MSKSQRALTQLITLSGKGVSNNPNATPVVDNQLLLIEAGQDLIITLGPLKNKGNSVTYGLSGISGYVVGPAANQITFNSVDVADHVITVNANDGSGTGYGYGTITVTVTAMANVAPEIEDQNLNAVEGQDLIIILDPDLLDSDGDTIIFTVSGTGAEYYTSVTANTGVFNTSSAGTKYLDITADDGKGGTDTSRITIIVTVNAQVAPESGDSIGWSLYYNPNNGHSSLPNGLDYASLDNHLPEFFIAQGLTHAKGLRMSPGAGGTMDAYDDGDVSAFIAASTADVFYLSGHSSGVALNPAGPPSWHEPVKTALTQIEDLGKVAIMTQGWENRSEPAYNIGNDYAKGNTDIIKAAHPATVMVRTLEMLKYMKANYPTRFNTGTSGYNNTPPTELFADSVHGTFALMYMQAAAVFRACTGLLCSEMNYVIPSYYGDMAAFKLELDETVNTIQLDFYPGITGHLLGSNQTPTANNFADSATHDVQKVVDVIAGSALADDVTIDTSLLTIDSLTASHFSATNLTAGVFTFTPNNSFTGNSIVNFKYVDAGGLEKTIVYTINIAALVDPNSAPVFSQDLAATKTVTEGADIALTVAVSNYDSIKWTRDGADIAGQTGTTLSLLTTLAMSGGVIKCLAIHGTTTVESNALTLTVNAAAANPEIWMTAGTDKGAVPPNSEVTNFINADAGSGPDRALVDTTGAATGITFVYDEMNSETTVTPAVGTDTGFLPDVVMQTSVYKTATEASPWNGKWTGLEVAATYNIAVTCSRADDTGRAQHITVGDSSNFYNMEAGNNRDVGFSTSYVADANGEIAITIGGRTGGDGGNGLAYWTGATIQKQ